MDSEPSPASGWPAARPLVKWTGGKSAELAFIGQALPAAAGRHIEPFVGGGAVLFAQPASLWAEVNDRSGDLIALYREMAALDPAFLSALEAIEESWTAVGRIDPLLPDPRLATETRRGCASLARLVPGLDEDAGQAALAALARKRRFIARLGTGARGSPGPLLMAALKGAAYTAVRAAFNRSAPGTVRSAMFWFLREFAYGGMFRTNSAGGFNVPYGGISYNARGMAPRFEQMASPGIRARLARCGLHCGDFEAFLDRARLRHDDFVFLDPPYDSAFSTYDGNAFTRADHCRLAGCMARMPAKWMLVIAATDFVRETYAAVPGARTVEFGKTYQGHILNRNDRGAVYLMITNYGIPAPDCARRGTERLQGRLPAAGELADGMPA